MSMYLSVRPSVPRIAIVLAMLMLAGCATTSALDRSRALIARGQYEDGLAVLQAALAQNPENERIRSALVSERTSVAGRLLADAYALIDLGQLDRAEAALRRIIEIEPGNARAVTGLKTLAERREAESALDDAEALRLRGELDEAAALVEGVLRRQPASRRAQDLRRTVAGQRLARDAGRDRVLPALRATYRKPVSLAFRNANLLQVFEALRQSSGLNFVFDSEVKLDSPISMTLKAKPFEDVLKTILSGQHLAFRAMDEDTLLVYPNTPDKQRDYQNMVIRTFYVTNGDVLQMSDLLRSIVKVRDVHIDERLNMLVVRDTPEQVRLAEKVLLNADIAEPEVTLELEVLEVSLNRLSEIGIRFPDSVGFSVQGSAGPGQLTLPEFQNRNSSLVNLILNDPLAAINLRRSAGSMNLLANPRIRTKNRQIARVLIGERVPVITTTATINIGTAESVSYLDVGLKLELEPVVSLDNEVSMKIALEVSSITGTVTRSSGLQAYRLGTRNASTQLRVRDGETQVLAGLIQQDERRASTSVPGLGDIPAIGRLFENRQDDGTKTEIILLITPRVVRNVVLPPVDALELEAPSDADLGISATATTGIGVPVGRTPNAPGGLPVVPAPTRSTPGLGAPVQGPNMPSPFQSPALVPSSPSFGPGSPGTSWR